ncbi:MAG: hypothetical protein L0271_22350 [Gemmatimonadetes bacterium]|nr:hypothetical protein [Gemmatimonadota bacterium]
MVVSTSSGPSGRARLQRRTRVDPPATTREDATTIVKRDGLDSGATLGQTAIVLNGTEIRPGANSGSALTLPTITHGVDTANSEVWCRATRAIDLVLGHNVRVLTAPPRRGWRDVVTVDEVRTLSGTTRACRGRRGSSNVNFTITARPNAAALATRVEAAENEHVVENTAAFNRHLVPLHDRIAHHAANTTRVPCTTTGNVTICRTDDCVNRVATDINAAGRIRAFSDEQRASVATHDAAGGDHHLSVDKSLDASCRNLTFRVDARPPRTGTQRKP